MGLKDTFLRKTKRVAKAITAGAGTGGAIIGFSTAISPVTLPLNIVVGVISAVGVGALTYAIPNDTSPPPQDTK